MYSARLGGFVRFIPVGGAFRRRVERSVAFTQAFAGRSSRRVSGGGRHELVKFLWVNGVS